MKGVIDYIRDINYQKWIPIHLAVMLHVLVFLFFVSLVAMSYALMTFDLQLAGSGWNELLPFHLNKLLIFYDAPEKVEWLKVIVFSIVALGTWLFGTRLKPFNKTLTRRKLSFILCMSTVILVYCYYAALFIIPIGYNPIMNIHDSFQSPHLDKLHRGSVELVATVIMILPYLLSFFVIARIIGIYREDELVQEWFASYKYEHRWLGRYGDERANLLPDITLAKRVDTGVPAVLTGDSRQLGVLLIGPPGSGKTSLKIIKAFRQDMGHMQKMINNFPKLIKKYGHSDEFKRALAKYLIGSIVIEPAKDLCDSAYEVAKKHGIPEELIVYLDPSNEDTDGFNCMIGPLSQVAETITAVLDGMSEVSNEFFRQSCRTVLKMYIYLLKIHALDNCTLLDLDRMYQDPRYTMDLVDLVEATIPKNETFNVMSKDERIYWMLVQRVIRWFKNDALEVMVDRDNMILKYPEGHEHAGRVMIRDKQSEFTRQTRNLLSDLIVNPFLARILIGESTVDIDRILTKGGILLCNTDNGLLGDVSDAFGKLVLMSVQNAVFRRKGDENTRALVSLFVDEFYDYMNRPFLKLSGQGRKYKIASFVACQSLSQFAVKFGIDFVEATLGTIRNHIVYGGVTEFDASKLSKYFGEERIDEMSIRENITPDQMNAPNYSYSETIVREDRPVASADNIMFNPFKFSYIRLISEGSTKKAIQAEGDFIDRGESEDWGDSLDPVALEQFMQYWRSESTEAPDIKSLSIPDDKDETDIISEIDKETELLQQVHVHQRFEGAIGSSADADSRTVSPTRVERVKEEHTKSVNSSNVNSSTKETKGMGAENEVAAGAGEESESLSFSKDFAHKMQRSTTVSTKNEQKVVEHKYGINHNLNDHNSVDLNKPDIRKMLDEITNRPSDVKQKEVQKRAEQAREGRENGDKKRVEHAADKKRDLNNTPN